jgi:hypothetical protein
MGKIINVLLLIIIFVFDPLAISLVVAANFAFDKAYPKKKYKENLYGEEVLDLSPRDISKIVKENENSPPPNEALWEAAEKRMEIIGQNGNDGEHYSELDLNKDGKIDQSELKIAKDRIQYLQNSINGVTKSSNRVDKALKEIKNLEALISSLEDDLTIRY